MKHMTQKTKSLWILTLLAAVTSFGASTVLANGVGKSLVLKGQVCQGANYYNGEPITDYANTESFLPPDVFAFWNNFAVPEVGVMHPTDPNAKSEFVTADTPLDYIMATIDPGGGFGIVPVPEELLNIPINEAHVLAGPPLNPFDVHSNGQTRRFQIPGASESQNSVDLVRNKIWEDPITLERWNKATGTARYSCDAKGNGYVRIRARNLIPGVPYTVWEVFAINNRDIVTNQPFLNLPPQISFESPIAAAPFGGIPNTVVADSRGSAVYERELNYCPLDTDNNPLMYNAFFLHWDNNVYGAWFDQSGVGFPIGVVAGDHLCFPVGNHLLEANR